MKILPFRYFILALLACCSAGTLSAQTSFRVGDVYLSTPVFFGASSSSGALLRIDPVAGTTSLFLAMPGSPNGADALAYDPFRDRLVVRGGFSIGADVENYLVDAHGHLTSLGEASVVGPMIGGFAPSHIGNIYYRGFFSNTEIRYYDSSDTEQRLMNADGSAPWSVPGISGLISHMMYHRATNSLLIAYAGSSFTQCSGGNPSAIVIRRADLSPDGSRVLNVACFEFDLDPNNDNSIPVGLSPGPGDDVLLTIDDNTPSALPRMVRIDPATLTATPFAVNSSPSTNAGCYSHSLGKALVLDTGTNDLRAFAPGSIGSGTIVATGVSWPGGSGEVATLAEIGLSGNSSMTADTATISSVTGGGQNWMIDFGPSHANESYLVIGSATGWTPGVDVGSVHVPLIPDVYSSIVINRANSSFFPMSRGILDGQGRAQSAIQLSPGISVNLIGLQLYHATVCFSATPMPTASTNAVSLTID